MDNSTKGEKGRTKQRPHTTCCPSFSKSSSSFVNILHSWSSISVNNIAHTTLLAWLHIRLSHFRLPYQVIIPYCNHTRCDGNADERLIRSGSRKRYSTMLLFSKLASFYAVGAVGWRVSLTIFSLTCLFLPRTPMSPSLQHTHTELQDLEAKHCSVRIAHCMGCPSLTWTIWIAYRGKSLRVCFICSRLGVRDSHDLSIHTQQWIISWVPFYYLIKTAIVIMIALPGNHVGHCIAYYPYLLSFLPFWY